MDWQNIAGIMIGSAGISTAAIIGLSKILFKSFLSKDLETHKAKLKAEVNAQRELLKKDHNEYQSKMDHELSRINEERSVVFSKLHVDRADIVKNLHAFFWKLDKDFVSLVSVPLNKEFSPSILAALTPDARILLQPTLMDKFKGVFDSFFDMREYYRLNSIYFDGGVRSAVEELIDSIGEITTKVSITYNDNPNSMEGAKKLIDDSWDIWNGKIALIQVRLEEEFRKLLGVN